MNKTANFFAILTVVVAVVALFNSSIEQNSSTNIFKQFQEFQITYGREYSLEESIYRFKIFSDNLKKIEAHNSNPHETYQMGINNFADYTTEQFIGKVLMQDLSEKLYQFNPIWQRNGFAAPDSVDWRDKGVINPVKNQGSCGSCWAFSTTGAIESNLAAAGKPLNSFSEQQLVDCCGDKGYFCMGCNGAWPEWAMNYINAEGLVMEKEYPYTARKGTCQSVPTAKKYLNSAKPWTMIQKQNLPALQEALGSTGPISICVDASNWSSYRSGVFRNCGTSVLNHAVVAVGYQIDGTWIVRNSWGPSWGESGYIRLAAGNTCGIAEHAIVPNIV